MRILFSRTQYLPSIAGMFMLAGCCLGDYEEKNFHLADEHAEIVPYQQEQVVKFRNSSNEELDVKIQQSERSGEAPHRCPDCCEGQTFVDILITEFISATQQEQFPVLVVSPRRSEWEPNGSLQFFHRSRFNDTGIPVESNAKLPIDDSFHLLGTDEITRSSIEISNQVFEDVFYVTLTVQYEDMGNFHDFVYAFSEEFGLLRITDKEYQNSNGVNTTVSTETLVRVF